MAKRRDDDDLTDRLPRVEIESTRKLYSILCSNPLEITEQFNTFDLGLINSWQVVSQEFSGIVNFVLFIEYDEETDPEEEDE